jgi:chromosome segregation ATPase
MTNEDMQRTMEFIVEQQAQFASNIQRLEEERVRDTPRLTRLEESFQLLVRLAENTDLRLDRIESATTALESKTNVLEATTTALAVNMSALAAAQTHADERLTALIDIVREERNGTSH